MSDNLMSKGEVVGLIIRLAALTTVSYFTMVSSSPIILYMDSKYH